MDGTNNVDTLTGSFDNDLINALGGDDLLDGGAGGLDTLRGGSGDDTYIIDDQGAQPDVIEEFEQFTDPADTGTTGGIDTVESARDYTLGNFLENLTLTGTAIRGNGNYLDNRIIGNSEDNLLSGEGGADTLEGGAGNDRFNSGGAGDIDSLKGGSGDDLYAVSDTGDIITELADDGEDTVQAYASYTLSANVENLLLMGTNNLNGTGSSGNNEIFGNGGNNLLDGEGGIDSLFGGAGDDTFITDGDDTIIDSAGTDTVRSSASYTLDTGLENLVLTGLADIDGTGNAGNNTITGNSGSNTLDGDGGTDTLDGGEGSDVYIVDTETDTIRDSGTGDSDTIVVSSGGYNMRDDTNASGIENLILTGSASSVTGNNIDNRLTGNNLDNFLAGNGGSDTLIGGVGNDTYFVDASDNVIEDVGEGTDLVQSFAVSYTLDDNVENLNLGPFIHIISGTGNNLANIINGNDNNNTLSGGGDNDTISGGLGDDNIDGDAGNDDLSGGGGNDTLDGVLGNDNLNGGDGNDTYIVNSQTLDVITGESVTGGTDTIESSVTYALDTNLENLTLTGTSAINGRGNEQNNVIIGNGAANIFDGFGGIDTLMGGGGNDIYIVDTTTDTVIENAGQGTDIVQSFVSYTLGANLENLELVGGINNIDGTGNSLNNRIIGNSGNNVLNGVTGSDTLIGGSGNDYYFVNSVGDVTTEAAGEGNDTIESSISWTLATNVDNLILTGTATSGTGNFLNNEITGNAAVNTLNGLTGNDTLNGGAGNDTYITDGGETITDSAGIDTLQSSVTISLAPYADLENLTLTGNANINGTGNSLNNTITGNSGNNTLDGGLGADILQGGLGNDTYSVNSTTDQTIESASAGTDLVMSSLNWTLSANVENLTLTGTGNTNGTGNSLANRIDGNNGDNILRGGGGADFLVGGGGNDTLIGQAGADQLFGLAGADNFTFYSTSEGIDSLGDFTVVNDTIQVSRAGFGGGLSLGTIAASQFVVGAVAADASDRFIYNRSNGVLFFDPTGSNNGATDQVQFATLAAGITNMTNNDIFVIA